MARPIVHITNGSLGGRELWLVLFANFRGVNTQATGMIAQELVGNRSYLPFLLYSYGRYKWPQSIDNSNWSNIIDFLEFGAFAFNNNFEVEFTNHHIHSFKMDFGIFTELCNDHHDLILEYFKQPPKKPHTY